MTRQLQRPLPDLAMSISILDRGDRFRGDANAFTDFWTSPNTQLLQMFDGGVVIDEDVNGKRLVLLAPTDIAPEPPADAILLGLHEGIAYFGLVFHEGDDKPEGLRHLRDVGPGLTELESELVCTTLALSNWHKTHQYCPICGTPTQVARAGWVRQCPQDESLHFPRTDPAVIMLVTNERDEALLGHRAPWPQGWFSTLAGFVEPGESAESAVVREAFEEATINVDPATVVCLGSQPWPFPSSLMVGFRAHSFPGQQPQADGEEISEVRWFSREELASACGSGEIQVPPRFSISRHLIEDWYGAELPGSWGR